MGLPVYRDGVAPAPVPDRDQQKPSYSSGGRRRHERWSSRLRGCHDHAELLHGCHARHRRSATSASSANPRRIRPSPISPGEDLMPDQWNRSQRARRERLRRRSRRAPHAPGRGARRSSGLARQSTLMLGRSAQHTGEHEHEPKANVATTFRTCIRRLVQHELPSLDSRDTTPPTLQSNRTALRAALTV